MMREVCVGFLKCVWLWAWYHEHVQTLRPCFILWWTQMSAALQVLRQLQQGLAKCYSVAFEKSGAVSDAKITPHTLNFVKKLVSTFGVGLENVSNVSTMFSSAASESLARRAQATAQDPVFQKMKGQFTTGQLTSFTHFLHGTHLWSSVSEEQQWLFYSSITTGFNTSAPKSI